MFTTAPTFFKSRLVKALSGPLSSISQRIPHKSEAASTSCITGAEHSRDRHEQGCWCCFSGKPVSRQISKALGVRDAWPRASRKSGNGGTGPMGRKHSMGRQRRRTWAGRRTIRLPWPHSDGRTHAERAHWCSICSPADPLSASDGRQVQGLLLAYPLPKSLRLVSPIKVDG